MENKLNKLERLLICICAILLSTYTIYNIVYTKPCADTVTVQEQSTVTDDTNTNNINQTNNIPTKPENHNITIIGDSLSVGIKNLMPDNYQINAKIGRQFSTGVQIAESINLNDIIVIELGTNGPITDNELYYLINLLGNRKIYLVTNYCPTLSWEYDNNNKLRNVAAKYNNVHIIDWNYIANIHPEIISNDHVHPTPAGYAMLSELIISNINN